MQNISIEAAKAKGFISGYRVGRIILACSIERWKYGKLLKELREDCTNIFKFHTGRRTRYYYCLLYTSDAADDLLCVDLGGRRII